mgnify:CR=1 FL=1|jgi:hypothetical protein
MTATSAASTLGDSWNRLPARKQRPEPQAMPMPAGIKLSPPALAVRDLPQGKVLVAVDDALTALDLQRVLHDAGFRVVGPASTVTDIQRMIQRGDIDCAILDADVDRKAPLPVADLLAFADIPFVYLATAVLAPLPWRHRHRPVVGKPFSRDVLIAAVEKAMARSREPDRQLPANGSVLPFPRVFPPL